MPPTFTSPKGLGVPRASRARARARENGKLGVPERPSHAKIAADASEAAADQGAFWEMHDLLLAHQDSLEPDDLVSYADQIGLDLERFRSDLREPLGAGRVAEDVDSADLSGVTGTPTFFVNGRRHYGAYDIATLSAAVRAAGARALVIADAT
jgi:protein-disulfide isomerase